MDVAIKIITTVTASNSIDAIAASKAAAADLRHEAAVLARVSSKWMGSGKSVY